MFVLLQDVTECISCITYFAIYGLLLSHVYRLKHEEEVTESQTSKVVLFGCILSKPLVALLALALVLVKCSWPRLCWPWKHPCHHRHMLMLTRTKASRPRPESRDRD